MKTKSIFKKLAALAVVLALVLSLGGAALAAPKEYVTVIFKGNGGTPAETQIKVEVDEGWHDDEIEFRLPGKADFTFSGHLLTGWKIGSRTYDPGQRVEMEVRKSSGRYPDVIATACWIEVEEHYILQYDITPAVDGQPADPPDEHSDSPIVPGAVVSMADYYFTGWTDPVWDKFVDEMIDGKIVRVYDATVTGFFTKLEVVPRTTYTLIFQNKQPGVVFWPDDIIGSEIMPSIPGDPLLVGYRFVGWDPGTLKWDKAKVTVTYDVITPEGDDAPYLLVTTNLALTIAAVFEGIPTPVTPIEAPQTGDVNYLGYAMLLLGLSAGLAGFVFVRSRRKN